MDFVIACTVVEILLCSVRPLKAGYFDVILKTSTNASIGQVLGRTINHFRENA